MNISEIIKRFGGYITVADIIICLAGAILFGGWLLKTSLGRKALANSVPRRNNMPVYLPFIPLFIWFGAVSVAIAITRELLPDLPDWQGVFLDNLILCIGAIAGMGIIIFLAEISFVRRLKGFGLNVRTIHKDFFVGVVNLLSVLPLVLLMIILTTLFGKLIWGQEFEMQQHQELELIRAYPQLPVRVLIIVTAAAIVPAFEEMLFRGLFQTMLRSFFAPHQVSLGSRLFGAGSRSPAEPTSARTSNGAWLSIAISSGLFTIVHPDMGHWPALFVLSLCLGYSYEKSGSLFRPIFIHSLFNALSITAALNQ